jgi:hypothetical protein
LNYENIGLPTVVVRLFKDDDATAEVIQSRMSWMVMNNEQTRIWKKTVAVC